MIPLKIRPSFFIFSGLIGYLSTQDLFGTLVWVAVIFVSVLFHEYGHALTALAFGRSPRIELVALGGLTYHDGAKLSYPKQFLIVFNGPLFGFGLFLLSSYLLTLPSLATGTLGAILSLLRAINLFWTVVNLLPVLPLDGGQLLRILLEFFCGGKGLRYTFGVSLIVSVIISLYFFFYGAFLIGAIFALLAFQSYVGVKSLKAFAPQDQREDLKALFIQGEEALQKGKKEEALTLFKKVREQAEKGLLYQNATFYLALLYEAEHAPEKSYPLLKSIRKDLSPDGLCLLHKVAFQTEDYPLVTEIAGECFQQQPTLNLALYSAYAHAILGQVEPAVGWLETAASCKGFHSKEVLDLPYLDSIRHTERFQKWAEKFLLS